jgi:hypothetical protein
MKVSELQGAALDWAVAECEEFVEDEFEPSENWAARWADHCAGEESGSSTRARQWSLSHG